MSKCLNKVLLVGYCGKDIAFSDKGVKKVASFSVATSYSAKNPDGSYKDITEWNKITCFDNLARIAKEYLKKGSFVLIEGTLKTSSYKDKHDIDRSVTRIIAKELKLLDNKDKKVEDSPKGDLVDYDGPEIQKEVDSAYDALDDDIPF